MKEFSKKEQTNTFGDNDIKETHPAFGMISLSRCSCTPSANLFGSAVQHGHFITLSIKKAHRTTSVYKDWYSADEELIQVCITGNQLGDLLTSMNVGDGVPCTLNRVMGKGIPDIAEESNILKEAQDQMVEKLKKNFEVTDKMVTRAEELLKSSTPLKKSEKEELLWNLTQIKRGLVSNVEYAGKCFNEKTEKLILQAKGEVETYINTKITSAGLQALGGTPIVEINYNKEK